MTVNGYHQSIGLRGRDKYREGQRGSCGTLAASFATQPPLLLALIEAHAFACHAKKSQFEESEEVALPEVNVCLVSKRLSEMRFNWRRVN